MVEGSFFRLEKDGELLVVYFRNPPANVLNSPAVRELKEILESSRANPSIKSIIITSSLPRYFIAGFDVHEISKIRTHKEAVNAVIEGKAMIQTLLEFPVPTITAINGFCLGGGLELALACHFRIASEKAKFGQPEINLGLIPGWGGTQRLPRLIGDSRALELVLTGELLEASTALRYGLVNAVVGENELIQESKNFARKMSQKSRVALSAAVKCVRGATRFGSLGGLELETEEYCRLLSETHDASEGIRAFIEKRPPVFEDR